MKDGGPAFPVVHAIIPNPGDFTTTPPAQPGMTLRDYFAAQAMAAIIIAEATVGSSLPAQAYRIADALLDERERTQEKL